MLAAAVAAAAAAAAVATGALCARPGSLIGEAMVVAVVAAAAVVEVAPSRVAAIP